MLRQRCQALPRQHIAASVAHLNPSIAWARPPCQRRRWQAAQLPNCASASRPRQGTVSSRTSGRLALRASSSLTAGTLQPEEWPGAGQQQQQQQQQQQPAPPSAPSPAPPPPQRQQQQQALSPAIEEAVEASFRPAPAPSPQQQQQQRLRAPGFQLWALGSPLAWGFMLGYTALMLILPISALLAKASRIPVEVFVARATEPVALSAYYVSFSVAIVAGIINAFFGFILAWVLVKYDFPGKKWIDAAVDLPFALPTSVAGLTLATVYSEEGVIGAFLTKLGINVVFTRLGVAVAMVFVSFPFVVRTMQPVLQEMEKEVEEAAYSLGASPWTTFVQVLLPPLLPPLLTGTALAFSRALGEFGSIVIVSSNFPFKDLIAPVLIFQCLEQYDYVGATVIGTVLLMISLVMMVGVNWLQSYAQRFKR